MELDTMKEMVIQASHTFYSTQDKEQRKSAEDWLNNFKKSVHAWFITDQILHAQDNVNEQVLFFAAQTIRTKIQYYFHELPLDSHESLRRSLLEHLENFSTSNYTTVQTQIYIALSDLIMLMGSDTNPVPEIIQRFNRPPDRMNALIEFLTILPEEINNKRLKLGQNRRDQMRAMFANSSAYIIEFLETNLNALAHLQQQPNNNAVIKTRLRLILRCFSSWIEEQLIDHAHIANSQLFLKVFQILSSPDTESELHEVATNCVVNMLIMYPFNVKANELTKGLLLLLKDHIVALAPAYRHAAEVQHDLDKCIDLALVFSELGNALSWHLVNEPGASPLGDLDTALSLLILIGSHSDYEVFQKSFNFWFNIAEEIYTSPASEHLCKSHFAHFVSLLIDCICKHCCIDLSAGPNVKLPPTGELGDFRAKASDLVADVVFMVEAQRCFDKMLRETLQAPDADYSKIEAALFVMCAFAKNVSAHEDSESVVQVVQAIVGLPGDVHVAVRYTGTRLLGELAEWLNAHPALIDAALNFIFTGFSTAPACHVVAANAMLAVCTKCQAHMLCHLDTLLNIVQMHADHVTSADASMGLLKSAIVTLCHLQPASKIAEPLLKICVIQLEGLQKVIEAPPASQQQQVQSLQATPLYWLDRLTAIFRTIRVNGNTSGANDAHPCQPAVQQCWPTLSAVLHKYERDAKVTESCCRTLRFALRCTEKHSRLILNDVASVLVAMYARNHFSCYLYLGSILVDIYGNEPSLRSGLVHMLQTFTQEAFQFILKSCGGSVDNVTELRRLPDTVDDFFRLAMRFVQRCPCEMLQSAVLMPVLHLGVTALGLDHRDASVSVTKFLSEFVALAHKPQVAGLAESNESLVGRVLLECGGKMVENAISATINMTTRDTKDGIADLMSELSSAYQKQFETDLLNVLKSLRKCNQHGIEIVSESQLMEIHAKIMQSNSSSEIETALIQLEQLFM